MSANGDGNQADFASAGPLRAVVLTVRFGTELALLAVLVIVGVNASTGLAGRIAIAVVAPVLAATIWGIGIAPRARTRWPDPWRLIAEFALFVIAAAALAVEGNAVAAAVFAVLSIGTAFAVRVVAPAG